MNVLFVITNINGTYNDAYSFGLASIASITRDKGIGYNYAVINTLEDCSGFFDLVGSKKPRVIAYTSVSSQFMYVREISSKIKEAYNSEIIQVCGGIHPTIFPGCLLEAEALDGIFIGEGELAFGDFLDRVSCGTGYKDVNNFAYRDNGGIVKNPLYPLVSNLDEIPFPERDKYGYRRFIEKDGYAAFMFSRGCPYSCSYCSNHAIAKAYNMPVNKPRYRSPQSSIEEIKQLINKFPVEKIYVVDDTFGLNKNWLSEFCNKYAKEIKLPLVCQLRVNLVNEELMEYLKLAGCVHVACGVESGNSYIRNEIMKRDISQEQILRAYALFKKYGISSNAINIIGLPHETLDGIRDTIRLNRKIKPVSSGVNIFYPYRGTELGDYCFEKGLIDEGLYHSFSMERRDTVLNFPKDYKKKLIYYKENWDILVYPFNLKKRLRKLFKETFIWKSLRLLKNNILPPDANKTLSRLCFVERLTAASWFLFVLPFLIRNYRDKKQTVFYIDASAAGTYIARLMGQCLGIKVEHLLFRLLDIRDKNGDILRLSLAYRDYSGIQEKIIQKPVLKNILSDERTSDALSVFLKRQLAIFDWSSSLTVWRALLLVNVAKWKQASCNTKEAEAVLFMDRRMWMDIIRSYAMERSVRIIPVKTINLSLRLLLACFLGPRAGFFIKHMYFYIKGRRWVSAVKGQNPAPRIGVEYQRHLNLEHPALHSELFFLQQSSLSGDDIAVYFNSPSVKLSKEGGSELRRHNIKTVSIYPGSSEASLPQVFLHRPHFPKNFTLNGKDSAGHEKRWVQDQVIKYCMDRDYWADMFSQYNIKVHIAWDKYTANHCIQADALKKTGGVSAIYQQAFEEFPSPATAIASDIAFGFSALNADIELKAGSAIGYYVTVGYFGDHRFALLGAQAQQIRRRLQKNGAAHILAFLDENSTDDSRWHTGHEFMRVNYEFLLEKLLSEPSLGVVFKPKSPNTLRQRLGPTAKLLKKAEETGRCFVYEGGLLHSSYPPAAAALASDVAIHGHLCAATAGMESALAGVRTLLLDREGWSTSKLYRLGRGKAVFTDWQDLWKACQKYWQDPSGIPGFGDWAGMLDELDPFRDGHAAERIGTYLKWLLEGFKAGLSREAVLADAAERYGKAWGKSNIKEITN